MSIKNIRALFFGVMVSLLAFYFALRNIDLSSLIDTILSANVVWLTVVLFSYVLHFWLKALRWCDLLEPLKRIRARQAYPVMMTGFFANNLLPAHLGEFVRMFIGSKVFQLRKTGVFGTILLERILDFSTIILIFGGVLIRNDFLSSQLTYAAHILVGFLVVLWVVLFIALRYEKAVFRFVGWVLKPFPGRFGKRLTEMLTVLLGAMHSMKSLRLVMRSLVFSVLQWMLAGLAIYASLRAVGLEVDMAGVVVTLTATVLAVSLPAAPGFFGTIQLAFVIALVPYGVSENSALAASVIFHIISYLFVMVSGVVALHRLNMRISDLSTENDRI